MKIKKIRVRDAFRIGLGITILTTLLFVSCASALSNSGGGNWQHYKNITLDNSGSSLSDYQVLVNLTGGDFPVNAQPTGADVRFTNLTGNEMKYWVEKWDPANSSALVWVNVTNIPSGTSTIRMFYGNTLATSSSNGAATFEFFDDFEGSYDSSWTLGGTAGTNPSASTDRNYTGSYSLKSPSGSPTGGKYLTKSDKNFGTNISVDVEFYDPNSDTTTSNMFFADDGVTSGAEGVGSAGGITTFYAKRFGSTFSATSVARSTGWHKFSFHTTSSGIEISIDNISVGTNTSIVNISRLFVGSPWSGPIVTNYYYDTVKIRKHVPLESSNTIGAEQNKPTVVYVDVAYNDGNAGGHFYGYDAFNTIQGGVNAVASGGTVNVDAGTFTEQIDINQPLTLLGAGEGSTIIYSPSVLATKFTTSGANKPIVYVNNTIGVTLEQFTVDGAGLGNANYRMDGIAFNNAGGTVDHVTIIGIRETPLSGSQQGVALYAYNADSVSRTLIVSNNTISDFQKNGMTLNGAGLTVTVKDNTVTGAGPTGLIAQNGIQVSSGADGIVGPNNVVSNVSYTGPIYGSTGILVYNNVDILKNTVNEAQVAVYFIDGTSNISENTITATAAGTSVSAYWGIVVLDPPQVLPSPLEDEISGTSMGTMSISGNVVNVLDNTITGGSDSADSVGVEADAGYYGTLNLTFSATGNTISGWGYGVKVDQCNVDCTDSVFDSIEVHQNNIAGNSPYGVWGNVTVNATYNWWGSASGPGPVGPGTGDNVSTNVLYDPWLGQTFNYYLPFLYQRADLLYDAGVHVQNDGTESANVTIQLYNLDGTSAGSGTYTVLPGELMTKHAFDITGTMPVYVGPAVVTSNVSVEVQGYIKTVNEGVYSIAPSSTTPEMSGYIPFLYQRADNMYDAGVQVFNPGTSTATVTITMYNLDGTTAGTGTYTVAPNAEVSKYAFDIVTGMSIYVGPVSITSDEPIVAQGFIRTKATNIYSIAPSVSTSVLWAYLPFLYQRADNMYDAGVQVFNPGTETATVTIVMRNLDGTTAGSGIYTVAPNAEVSKYAFDIVTGMSIYVGSVEVFSTAPIVAQGFIRTKASNVYSIAPQVRTPVSAGKAHVPFLYQTVSATHDAGIQVMNPGLAANVSIKLYYPDGTLAGSNSSIVATNAEVSKYVFDIAPGTVDFNGYAVITADQPIVSQGFIRKKSSNIYSIAPPVER